MRLTSRELHLLTTNPRAKQEYFRIGRVTVEGKQSPMTPLLVLICSIPPRDRLPIKGIHVCPGLGFTRVLHFQNASQLFNWLSPAHGSYSAANASANKRFSETLTIDDLRTNSSEIPERILKDWWARHRNLAHLRRR